MASDNNKDLLLSGDENKDPLLSSNDNKDLLLWSDKNKDPLLSSNDNKDLLLSSDENKDPTLSSNDNKDPLLLSDGNKDPLLSNDENKDPLLSSNDTKDLLLWSDENKDASLSSNDNKDPLLSSNDNKDPLLSSNDIKDPLLLNNDNKDALLPSNGNKNPLLSSIENKDPLLSSDENSYHNETEIYFEADMDVLPYEEIVFQEETLTNTADAEMVFQDEHLASTEKVDKSVQTLDYSDMGTRRGFSFHHFKDNDKALHFYTGLENVDKFKLVFNTLGECVDELNYFYGPPPQGMESLEQFFITLLILRGHKSFKEIAVLYQITIKQVKNIFITWIRLMSLQWRNIDLWVDKETVKAYMPLDFYDKYPSTRVLLFTMECPIQKPELPLAQQVTFSSRQNRNTVKVLIGVTPGGLISYVSPSYGGSATDRQLIERSSILTRFDSDDEIMVDRSLHVQDIFQPYGVKVNMKSFFKKGNQSAPKHLVQRVTGSLKAFKILSQPMNQTETTLSSDIVFICAMLVNFQSNINQNA